jgi:hypothetical protein
MIKKLRLLIARWALKPQSITIADLKVVCGLDIDAIIKRVVIESQAQLAPELAQKILAEIDKRPSTSLPDAYK